MALVRTSHRSLDSQRAVCARVEDGRALFRLTVADLEPHLVEAVKTKLLRSAWGCEWFAWEDFTATHSLLRAFGKARIQHNFTAWHHAHQLTSLVWDVLGDITATEAPDVWFDVNPDELGEESYSLTGRHWGQYRRRRREYEAAPD